MKKLLGIALLLCVAGVAFGDGMPAQMSKEDMFFQAVREGNIAYVKNVLDNKELVIDVTNAKGETPLIVATDNNRLQMVVLLITYKPDMNKKDAAGRTALSIAQQKGYGAIADALKQGGAT